MPVGGERGDGVEGWYKAQDLGAHTEFPAKVFSPPHTRKERVMGN